MGNSLQLGTRGSLLATVQSRWVADQIIGANIQLKTIKSDGDDLSLSLMNPTIPGAFVNSLRTALLSGEVDFLVHSMKDLPSTPHPELTIAAIPKREDPREVLISKENRSFAQLASGTILGTSSPRRLATISQLNPELICRPIRGNIDSRIKKVRNGEYDAIILAAAGLARINRLDEVAEYFDANTFVPAPAQGALAIECRSDDTELITLLKALEDGEARITSTAERAVLQGLQVGCDVAIGAYAQLVDDQLTLTAELGGGNGIASQKFTESATISSISDLTTAQSLGLKLANLFIR